ncbi:MAG TPA: hypothetical protein VI977_03355 [archaeon]|nr:hypothetical protein [archaeon]
MAGRRRKGIGRVLRPRTRAVKVKMRMPEILHREWLLPGSMTKISRAVHDFAYRLPGTDARTDLNPERSREQIISIARAAVDALGKFGR